ncbi:cupin domain-containing protein [Paralimibaculum aggregatum]|uniref:Cupin domain-containing protein n=1 Tax=Paralimibaculum aggregatum TaxID=3036245 RepID=A0ABQ6LI05_9RHOB|nr:cupin domain-containing protein [Limibaculum sp. NKW23]GMG82921.1 cupin domain-containing protein [Limibaculum sp. NKW23]
MEITTAAEAGTRPAPADYFTGQVWQEPVARTPTAPPLAALKVSFAPGARTHWHTHPLGQTLHVLSGIGLVQARGAPARLIREGDSVWIPPGEEHWHGAAAGHAMCHLALQHVEGDAAVTWLDPVSEAEYAAAQG